MLGVDLEHARDLGQPDLEHRLALAIEEIKRLEALVYLDPLTGALNQRGFRYQLDHALADANRSGRPYALALFDLDSFKKVNDERGHTTGDTVLTEVVRKVRGLVRATDHIARIGGDEFAILFSDCSVAGAEKRVESMREAIQAVCADLNVIGLCDGASFGVAALTAADIGPADAAMYRDKNHRRQCSRSKLAAVRD